MDDYNVPVLVDAKTEYTKQLVNILRPHLYEGIQSIYKDASDLCQENNDSQHILRTFQDLLSNVPKWSQEIIDTEYNRIVDQSKCDWLEDLLTAVFVSHTKILTAIRIGKKHKKINLKVPKIDNFVHKVYIQVAREFWKTPFLFDECISTTEYQRNMKYSEDLISNSINETIRQQLPVKHILKEYLGNDYEDDEIEEEISNGITNEDNLKKLVQKEIENFNSNSEDSSREKEINSEENSEENKSGENKSEENNSEENKENNLNEIKLEDKQGEDKENNLNEIKLEDKQEEDKEDNLNKIKLEDKQGEDKENNLNEIKLEDKQGEDKENNLKEIKLEDKQGEDKENNLNEIKLEDNEEKDKENNLNEIKLEDKQEEKNSEVIDLSNLGDTVDLQTSDPVQEISLEEIKDIKSNNKLDGGNLLDNLDIPQLDSNIDFFGTGNDNFDLKKMDYETQNNVSNDVLDEFNKLNGNNSIRLNKKDDFNFFSDAEENE